MGRKWNFLSTACFKSRIKPTARWRGYPPPWSQLAQEQSMMLFARHRSAPTLVCLPLRVSLSVLSGVLGDTEGSSDSDSGPEARPEAVRADTSFPVCDTKPKSEHTWEQLWLLVYTSCPKPVSHDSCLNCSRIKEYPSIIQCALWSSACKTRTSSPSEATNTWGFDSFTSHANCAGRSYMVHICPLIMYAY